MVKHTLTIGKEEIEALIELSLEYSSLKKQRTDIRNLIWVLAALILLYNIAAHHLFRGIIIALIICGTTAALKPLHRMLTQRMYAKADSVLISGDREYIVDETGIEIVSPAGRTKCTWDMFIAKGEYSHYYWIQRNDRNMVLFDKHGMSAEELRELKGYAGTIV